MFHLASELGMTVHELTERMSWEELVTWSEFYKEKKRRHEKAQKEAERKRKQNQASKPRSARRRRR